jgi:hypothetical protein
MTTDADGARAGEIERRVVDWVTSAVSSADTSEGVGVEAVATRSASLPDDGLEVRPEDWAVEVALRFSAADEGASGDVLAAVPEGAATVTLDSGEAAEIAWPAGAADGAADRPADGPEDTSVRRVVAVRVSIPWPSRNDAAADAA